MDDPEKGIFRLAKKMQLGLIPVKNDTIIPLQISVEEMGESFVPLVMKPLYTDNDSVNGRRFYNYQSRPFKIEGLKMNTFIPLLLLGSMWYDEHFNIHRFCGEDVISPDMSDEILKYIPHYYIIGVKINPIEAKGE